MRTTKTFVRVGLVALTLLGACASEVTAPKTTQPAVPTNQLSRHPEDTGTMFPSDGPVVDQETGSPARGGYMVTSGRK